HLLLHSFPTRRLFRSPAFDSDACFAALLGTPRNGRWLIAPAEGVTKTSRRYQGDTLILETRFETEDGIVALIDFMPPRGKASDRSEEHTSELQSPDHL